MALLDESDSDNVMPLFSWIGLNLWPKCNYHEHGFVIVEGVVAGRGSMGFKSAIATIAWYSLFLLCLCLKKLTKMTSFCQELLPTAP